MSHYPSKGLLSSWLSTHSPCYQVKMCNKEDTASSVQGPENTKIEAFSVIGLIENTYWKDYKTAFDIEHSNIYSLPLTTPCYTFQNTDDSPSNESLPSLQVCLPDSGLFTPHESLHCHWSYVSENINMITSLL